VSGQDLIVHMDVLRHVASKLDDLATRLQGSIGSWDAIAAQARGAFGNWWAAGILDSVAGRAHEGVRAFSNDLRQAHSDTATRLTMSADKYDAAEQHITTLINASTDPSATIVESGGNNVAADPGYGQNWTPTQRASYEHAMRMDRGAQNWTGTYPVVEGTSFAASACYYYTWQEVQALLAATNPEAITAAGQAYLDLSNELTSITGQLASHGQTLAQNWGGPTAVTAVSQIQQLHQTATDMQASTYSAGVALNWYGPVLAAFKNSLPQPASTHPAAQTAADQAANQHMNALNGHIQTAYDNMPGAVNKNLPPALAGTGGSGTAGGVGGGGAGSGGGGAMPAVTGGAGPSVFPGPGVSGINPGSLAPPPAGPFPSGPQPPGTILSGGFPPPVTTPVGPGPSGPGIPPPVSTPGGGAGVLPPIAIGGGGGGITGIGTGTGGRGGAPGEDPIPGEPGSGFPGGGLTGGGSPRGRGLPPGIGTIGMGGEPGPISEVSGFGDPPVISPAGIITSGQGGLPGEDLAAPGDAAMGEGMGGPGGFPMMGLGGMSGGGQNGIGRDRAAWTTEEEGTWGPDAAASGPDAPLAEDGMPGMMPFAGTSSGKGKDQDRSRQAWMSEDDDLWDAGQPAVPPVISQNST
jgi:uncharacterized protein YukE